jgi:hypothetical protein
MPIERLSAARLATSMMMTAREDSATPETPATTAKVMMRPSLAP